MCVLVTAGVVLVVDLRRHQPQHHFGNIPRPVMVHPNFVLDGKQNGSSAYSLHQIVDDNQQQ
jgi:hypothetical protein